MELGDIIDKASDASLLDVIGGLILGVGTSIVAYEVVKSENTGSTPTNYPLDVPVKY